MTVHVVLLSGGSGTRLWPLSNGVRAKQFLKVLRAESGEHVSMVQRVMGQIDTVDADTDVTVAASEAQRDSIVRQLGVNCLLVLESERQGQPLGELIMFDIVGVGFN